MKKIIVTGGLGFIGSNLIDLLIKRKFKVINLDKITYSSNFYNVKEFQKSKKYKFIKCDIKDKKLKNILFKYRPDCIFNLAAETHVDRSIDNPEIFVKSNVNGVLVLLEQLRDYKKQNLNTACYISGYRGSPLGGYDQQIIKNEKYLKEKITIQNIYGNEEGTLAPIRGQEGCVFAQVGLGGDDREDLARSERSARKETQPAAGRRAPDLDGVVSYASLGGRERAQPGLQRSGGREESEHGVDQHVHRRGCQRALVKPSASALPLDGRRGLDPSRGAAHARAR